MQSQTDGEAITILLVEDDPAHAEIVRRSLRQGRVANQMIHVADGEDAIDYCYRRGSFADRGKAPRPGLMLLDLRLPVMDGLEVLARIRGDHQFDDIPIVILTTSAAETDLARAYACHANSYLVKPVDFTKFQELMDLLGYYWLVWNTRRG